MPGRLDGGVLGVRLRKALGKLFELSKLRKLSLKSFELKIFNSRLSLANKNSPPYYSFELILNF